LIRSLHFTFGIIIIDDHQPSNKLVVLSDHNDNTPTDYWIKELHLYVTDYEALQTKEITGNIVNAAHSLLKRQFPLVQGMQDTVLAHHLKFHPITPGKLSVQVLHTGTELSVITCVFIKCVHECILPYEYS